MDERIAAFIDGNSTFLIGVMMVLVALVLVILLIMLLGKVVSHNENGKVATGTMGTKIDEQVTISPQAIQGNQAGVALEEMELVAVITAAIAASLGTTSDKLQVRSLRKVDRRSRTVD